MPTLDDIARAIWEAEPVTDRPVYCDWKTVLRKSYLWHTRTLRQAQAVQNLLQQGDLTKSSS